MAGRRNHLPPWGWRIFLSIILAMGFYIVVSRVALHFFGEQAVAILDGADMMRIDARGDKDLMNRITVSYHFYQDGKEYRNSVVYRSGEILTRFVGHEGLRTVNIRYLEAFPYINSLEKLVDLSGLDLVYSLAAMGFFVWVFCIINGIGGKSKKSDDSRELQRPGMERITMAQLMNHKGADYDELVQAYYAEGWDKKDPSWKCRCGHWSAGSFCPSCGRRR